MTLKTVRIGSMDQIHQYDDGDSSYAVETDGVVKAASFEGGGGGGASGSVTVLTAIQAGGAGSLGIQYKNRSLTFANGLITTIGAESGWNDI